MTHFTGLLGIFFFLAVAWALSENRKAISMRVVVVGVLLQLTLAAACLKIPYIVEIFDFVARLVTKVISFADEGIRFLFGNTADPSGPWGFVFAIRVLPVIIFFASLMSVLYHLGVMQRVVAVVAFVLRRILKVSGVEAISAAANIFVGQTEAPLMVKPYIAGMTRSQLMAVMTGGFATIAGSVLAAYVGLLGGEDKVQQVLFAKHLLCASVMSAPAGFVMAKIMLPETQSLPDESLSSLLRTERSTSNVVDAAASGATDGLKLALNVAAMLLAFVALLAVINWPLAAIGEINQVATWRNSHGIPPLSLQYVLGLVFRPVAWLMGIPREDLGSAGTLLGTQIIATEFMAYLGLSKHIAEQTMTPRGAQIMTYALCGFANLPSIAIQIGGLSAMAPERRQDLATLAPRAMVAGAMACWMTGCVAGLFID